MWKESFKDRYSPCPKCAGTGEYMGRSGACRRCSGTGLDARNWRSREPEEKFIFLGQPVRVYLANPEKGLRYLIREKDYQAEGKTVSLLATGHGTWMVPFLLRDGRVIPLGTGAPNRWGKLYVPWTVISESYPDFMDLWRNQSRGRLSRAEEKRLRAIWVLSDRLGARMLQALQEHYDAKGG